MVQARLLDWILNSFINGTGLEQMNGKYRLCVCAFFCN